MNELEDIIKSGRETKSIDYKAPAAWNESDKKACCELVKDILAFANSGGGFIVIGVSETPTGIDHQGLSEPQLASFDTSRVNRFLQNYTDPPINCTIAKKDVDGRHYVVVEVPAFPDTPHICQKEYPGALLKSCLYVRTDNNESAPITSSADFRNIVELGVRNRQDRLLESFRAILVGANAIAKTPPSREQFLAEIETVQRHGAQVTDYQTPTMNSKYSGYREAWSFPSQFIADRLDLQTLRSIAQKASVEFRGRPFLYYGVNRDQPGVVEGGIEGSARFQDFRNQDRADYWYLGNSGLFYQRVLMWEESYPSASQQAAETTVGPMMDIREFAMYSAEAIKCISTLYDQVLEPNDEVTLGIRITGTTGRCLVNIGPQAMPLANRYTSKMETITYEKARTLADWRAGLLDHAVEICKFVFERFNWERPNLGLCRQTMENLFARKL